METLKSCIDLTEIIDGEEIVGPGPFRRHQRTSGNLYNIICNYVKARDLGQVYYSPLDIIFEEGLNRLQPDLLFVRKENAAIEQDWIRGVPDMVCEIISPGSYELDTTVKREIYERYGVPEFWIVLPEFMPSSITVEILTHEGGRYRLHSFAALDGVVTSKIIEGLHVNVRDIFE
ncbi:MAG: Uma2 family endonuclease [Nitrospirota bacterium]